MTALFTTCVSLIAPIGNLPRDLQKQKQLQDALMEFIDNSNGPWKLKSWSSEPLQSYLQSKLAGSEMLNSISIDKKRLGEILRNVVLEKYMNLFTDEIVVKLTTLNSQTSEICTELGWNSFCNENSLLVSEKYGSWLVFMYCSRFVNRRTRAKVLNIGRSKGFVLPTIEANNEESKKLSIGQWGEETITNDVLPDQLFSAFQSLGIFSECDFGWSFCLSCVSWGFSFVRMCLVIL